MDDFSYDRYKFGGLRFFLELAIFLAVKLGIENPKSSISFFRLCRGFLEGIEGLRAYNGYKYSTAAMINFLLFVRLCRFKKRESALEFLEKHKEWAIALGFHNGVPHESDVTKFINKIGADLDVYFVQLLRFIRENVSLERRNKSFSYHRISETQQPNWCENKDWNREKIHEV